LKDAVFYGKLPFAGSPHAIVCHLRVQRSTLIIRKYSITGETSLCQIDSFDDLYTCCTADTRSDRATDTLDDFNGS